jgi:outer membrane protein assembly factor BamE (lipoprotein component of BamABCDE complex)
MSRTRIVLAFIILFSTVCVAQRKPVEKWTDFQSWTNLRTGMTKTQVTVLLGQPKDTIANQTGSINIWYYQQIPPKQTTTLCDGCVVFKENRIGTCTLSLWQDPSWVQLKDHKKEKEIAIETAAQKAELERQVALTQRKLEQAERVKKALELKLQQQEEARKRRAEQVARARVIAGAKALEAKQEAGAEKEAEKEKGYTVSCGFLDRLCAIVIEYHFVLIGTILLAVALCLIFKLEAGRLWWRYAKKPEEEESTDLSQKYGIR